MRRAIELSCVLWLASCGGAQPLPKPPDAPPPRPQRAIPLVAKTSSELGSIDPLAVKRSFSVLEDKFTDCQKRALERIDLVSGNVKFFLRIGPDGSAKWSFLEESEIGDRETEKCLTDVVMATRWPRPDGGDAEAHYSMELPFQSTRPPSDWSPQKVAGALGKSGDAIEHCKAGSSANFRATMYVGPGGKVLAAGIAMSNKEGEDRADCLATVLVRMKGLPSPGSWPAKVTFGL